MFVSGDILPLLVTALVGIIPTVVGTLMIKSGVHSISDFKYKD